MRVSSPNIAAQILTYGGGERDTVEVLKTIPRVLNLVKQDKKQDKQQDDGRNPTNHHSPFDPSKHVVLSLLLLSLGFDSQVVQTVVRNEDSREEEAKDEPSDVGKVVDEGEEAENEEEDHNESEFDELDPREHEESRFKDEEHKHVGHHSNYTPCRPDLAKEGRNTLLNTFFGKQNSSTIILCGEEFQIGMGKYRFAENTFANGSQTAKLPKDIFRMLKCKERRGG